MPCPKLSLAVAALLLTGLLASPARAEEPPPDSHELRLASSLLERATTGAALAVNDALALIGIRYRRGGSSPETGYDCSGFVDHVFREGIGLILPHSAREIAKTGEKVQRADLQPGDLVFFNTMRRAFSHVGIYLGDHQFVHAPHTGAEVRIEDMRERYWAKRFDGARRLIATE